VRVSLLCVREGKREIDDLKQINLLITLMEGKMIIFKSLVNL